MRFAFVQYSMTYSVPVRRTQARTWIATVEMPALRRTFVGRRGRARRYSSTLFVRPTCIPAQGCRRWGVHFTKGSQTGAGSITSKWYKNSSMFNCVGRATPNAIDDFGNSRQSRAEKQGNNSTGSCINGQRSGRKVGGTSRIGGRVHMDIDPCNKEVARD